VLCLCVSRIGRRCSTWCCSQRPRQDRHVLGFRGFKVVSIYSVHYIYQYCFCVSYVCLTLYQPDLTFTINQAYKCSKAIQETMHSQHHSWLLLGEKLKQGLRWLITVWRVTWEEICWRLSMSVQRCNVVSSSPDCRLDVRKATEEEEFVFRSPNFFVGSVSCFDGKPSFVGGVSGHHMMTFATNLQSTKRVEKTQELNYNE